MKRKFYLDESGNSGDLIKRNKVDLDFSNQPRFSLSCVEFKDLDEVKSLIKSLKIKYKIQGDELKSKNIYKSQPEFMLELFFYINENKIPFFIELVDKKYFICTTIVNHHIFPPYFTGEKANAGEQIVKNMVADYMCKNMPKENYKLFFDACFSQTEDSLLVTMNALQDYFKKIDDNEDMRGTYKLVEESIDDYFAIKKLTGNPVDSLNKFIPIPDENNKGSNVWLLPHVSSLANIIARVNLFSNKSLDEISFIHDNQDHFNKLLNETKTSLYNRENSEKDLNINTADFDLYSDQNLIFGDSKNSEHSIGLQISDILAGFIVRYVNDVLYFNKTLDDTYHQAYFELSKSFDMDKGIGVNMVIPHSILEKNNIPFKNNFTFIA